jgi:hypothetical protein
MPPNMQYIYHGLVLVDFLLELEPPSSPSLTSCSTSSMLCSRRERTAIDLFQNFLIAPRNLGDEALSLLGEEGEPKS